MRGVTLLTIVLAGELAISTHTPHAGSDGDPPRMRREELISTRTPHAGSDGSRSSRSWAGAVISTRTPHAGSDIEPRVLGGRVGISTRTPHAGSDDASPLSALHATLFQPALPMRGVTR